MREQTINAMGSLIGIFLGTCLELRLFQGTIDKTIFGIHDGRLRVVARLFLHTRRGLIALIGEFMEIVESLFASHMFTQIIEHLTIMFQEFQRQISGRVVLGDMLIGLQVFLDVRDTILNLVSVVNMQVARELTGSLVYLNHRTKQFFDTHAILEGCGYHRCTKQGAEGIEIDMIATTLKLIVHIQGTHHADVHIHQLCGEVEVTFNIRRVDNVDDHIRHLFCQMFANVEFFW